MCGIVGVLDFRQPVDRGVLDRMTDTLAHRGPDSRGACVKSGAHYHVGLGHRRLSIIDLSPAGSQPMEWEGLTIVFNGEIYNYRETKRLLEERGHQFRSDSDTEVILHAYREWGQDMVHHFNGMFGFGLLDSRQETLYLFRDRVGVKPLYYYHRDGLWMFASELKAFHEHPGFRKALDPAGLSLFFQYGYIPQPYTIFQDTHKLKAGHYLRIDLRTGESREVKFWDVRDFFALPRLDISEAEAIAETERRLKSSFEYRMVSDVPVGVLLSGGYDSTAVTALLQHNRTGNIKTFTLGFEHQQFDEASYARDISRHLGTDHTEYYCTETEAKEILPELPYYFDEPFGDDSAIPTMLISRIARREVTVALSGDGGDELFAGYNSYPNALKHFQTLKGIPEPLRMPLSRFLEAIPPERIPYLRQRDKFPRHYRGMINILNKGGSLSEVMNFSHQKLFSRDIYELLGVVPGRRQCLFDDLSPLEAVSDEVARLQAFDFQTYLVDDLLTKTDRATMAHSLEGRDPFLDNHLIEFAAQLPARLKLHGKVKKYLLRQVVHRYVPRELIDRPKQGFAIPLVHWFRADLRFYFDQYFDPQRLRRQGIFSEQFIYEKLASYFRGRHDDFNFLWYLLIFQLWYERWMQQD